MDGVSPHYSWHFEGVSCGCQGKILGLGIYIGIIIWRRWGLRSKWTNMDSSQKILVEKWFRDVTDHIYSLENWHWQLLKVAIEIVDFSWHGDFPRFCVCFTRCWPHDFQVSKFSLRDQTSTQECGDLWETWTRGDVAQHLGHGSSPWKPGWIGGNHPQMEVERFGYPQIIHLNWIFHDFCHPALGLPPADNGNQWPKVSGSVHVYPAGYGSGKGRFEDGVAQDFQVREVFCQICRILMDYLFELFMDEKNK